MARKQPVSVKRVPHLHICRCALGERQCEVACRWGPSVFEPKIHDVGEFQVAVLGNSIDRSRAPVCGSCWWPRNRHGYASPRWPWLLELQHAIAREPETA